MRTLAIAVAAALWAGVCLAETARVRSIEFEDMTRVAIEFGSRPDWRARRTAEGYEIRFAAGGITSLEGGGPLNAQGSRRLDGIRLIEGGRGLDLLIGCACTARIYEFRDTSLVVDILEDVSGAADIGIGQGTGSSRPGEGSPVVAPVALGLGPAPEQTAPAPIPSRATDPAPRRMAFRNLPSPPAPTTGEPIFNPDPAAGRFPDRTFSSLAEPAFVTRDSHAIRMLSRELSRAIAQGLIDAPDPNRAVPASSTGPILGEGLESGRSNLTITTAMDRDMGARRARPLPTMSGSVCLPDREFEVIAWGDPNDRKVLGRLRTDAFDDTGEPSPSGMLDLIRYYLAVGFGAEASALTRFIEDPAQRELLRAMADIVDHGRTDRRILNGQAFCKGKAALWSLLAHDIDPDDKPSDTDYILSAFSELPLHMRVHLGPILSKRLQRLGFDAEAQIALNAVTRGGANTPAQDLTAARLGLSGTAPQTARDELEDLSRGTDLIAAEALLELLLDAERRGVPPDPAWVADAPSLVRATQGTDTAADLNLAGFRGRIALGAFDSLREALNEWSPGLTETARRDLAAAAVAAAGEVADDPTFLRTELAFAKILDAGPISKSPRLRVAERLIGLGLYDRALGYLPPDPYSEEERLLTARALSGLKRLDAAIALLTGLESPDTLRALGELYLRADRAQDAIDAFTRASEIERASLAAFGSGDWAWLERHSDDLLSAAARDLAGVGPEADDLLSAGNVALLERAAERRKHAETLLRQTDFGESAGAFTN